MIGRQLFDGLSFEIDQFFTTDEQREIEQLITLNGGQLKTPSDLWISKHFDKQKQQVDWLKDSLRDQKLHNSQEYTLDPSKFLSNVVVYCHELVQSDTELICAGVKAFGGDFRLELDETVTHIATLEDVQESCVSVLPHYFQDCFQLRMKCPEQPYVFPKPSILENNVDLPTQEDKGRFLANQFIYGPTLQSLKTILESRGATVQDQMNQETTMLITEFQDGNLFYDALDRNLIIGTLRWIKEILQRQEIVPPKSGVLFYPRPREGLKTDFLLSLSNYVGQQRDDIQMMAEHLNIPFSVHLTPQHTHLITCSLSGAKFEKALIWNTNVVNHLWLEETYSRWSLQREAKPRYTTFTPILQHLVNKTMLEQPTTETPRKKRYSFIEPNSVLKKVKTDHLLNVAMTGIKITGSVQKTLLDNLHLNIVDDPYTCDMLVASAIFKSEKLIVAIARGIPILSREWIETVLKTKTVPPIEGMELKDTAYESKHDYSLQQVLERSRSNKLFANMRFYLSPSIVPSLETISKFITLSGGSIIDLVQLNKGDTAISNAKDAHLHQLIRDRKAVIKVSEWVVGSILQQRLI